MKAFYLLLVIIAGCSQPLFSQKKKPAKVKTALAENEPSTVTDGWKQLNTTEKLIEITTTYGVMIAKLYDSTPLHRDNFVRLVEQKFYDSLLFHRVIEGFMIQGGDPTSKNATPEMQLGSGSAPGARVPAEFTPYFFHKKGALAAARDNNPQKASSNCQFYIVQGKPVNEQELINAYDSRIKPVNPTFSYSKTQKEIYSRIGGTPFLDQSYTVFGEVISGLEVIDKIAKAPKQGERPLPNVYMKIRLLN